MTFKIIMSHFVCYFCILNFGMELYPINLPVDDHLNLKLGVIIMKLSHSIPVFSILVIVALYN